ncbi:MAG: hypothetical protein AB7M12_11170 [Hyphomonadaceae bacterium]
MTAPSPKAPPAFRMRSLHLPFVLALLLAAPSAARADAPGDAAANLFAERTALLAADVKCRLLAAPVRNALTATAAQARAGANRAGWSDVRLDGVEQRAGAAGAARTCSDPLVAAAAKSATAGFDGWAVMHAIDLPGQLRAWRVRRTPDPNGGWLLSQTAGAARFGLRGAGDRAELAITLPEPAAEPVTARLYFRDRARAPRPLLNVPGLMRAQGLAGAAAPRSLSVSQLASARRIERDPKTGAQTLAFIFPPATLAALAALDPRESAEIALGPAEAPTQRFFIEIGDLAVAAAFLSARPL